MLGQQLQQVGTGDRQEETTRQFQTNFTIEDVRLFLQPRNVLPDLLGIFPTVFGNGIKEGDELLAAHVNLDDMLL